MLQWARDKTILVLDQKDVPVEVRARKIEEHRVEAYAMLIVYSFKDAQKCYELNKNIMMEVMIPNREKFYEFDETGIPWSNIIAFVGHTPPRDKELLQMIHAKGTCCMVNLRFLHPSHSFFKGCISNFLLISCRVVSFCHPKVDPFSRVVKCQIFQRDPERA